MKILVLYNLAQRKNRKTILDHLFSFKNWVPYCSFYYYNALEGIPSYLKYVEFDAVIFHTSILSVRWNEDKWEKIVRKYFPLLASISGYKVALPQDEFVLSEKLCELFEQAGVKSVYTIANPPDVAKFYPKERTKVKHFVRTLTGFVDEATLNRVKVLEEKQNKRTIDIGYRACSLPFWFGEHSQIKKEVAVVFNKNAPADLKVDVSTNDKDFFYGESWLEFLLNCRTMLGCLGGSSLHDPDGAMEKKVKKYLTENPQANFSETKTSCFSKEDGNIEYFALGPRHFECAMTKTCQVLVEGEYQGVLKPGVHYIEVKKDYSNLAEVFELIRDKEHCAKIAENAYDRVVQSGKYTYRQFASEVVRHIEENMDSLSGKGKFDRLLYWWLIFRGKMHFFVLHTFRLKRDLFKVFRRNK